MTTLADIFTWTCSHSGARCEDFLSLSVARLAARDHEFALLLLELCGESTTGVEHLRCRTQTIVTSADGRGVRTDVELLWHNGSSRRVVIECKTEDRSDSAFTDALRDQVKTYDRTKPRPSRVVALVVRRVDLGSRTVLTWWQLYERLDASGRADWREVARLLERAEVAVPASLPNLPADQLKAHLATLQTASETVRACLPQLLPSHVRGSLRQRLDDEEESWAEDELGWSWWGSRALPGTALQGISLYALAEGGGLHWWLDVLPSNATAAAAVAKSDHMFAAVADAWWSADLGTLTPARLGGQIEHATALAAAVLRASGVLFKGDVAGVHAAKSEAERPTVELAAAASAVRHFGLARVALQREAIRFAHSCLAKFAPLKIWGESSGTGRFYLLDNRLEVGVAWDDEAIGADSAITLWIWGKGARMRAWVEKTVGAPSAPVEKGHGTMYYALGSAGSLSVEGVRSKIEQIASAMMAARKRLPRGK